MHTTIKTLAILALALGVSFADAKGGASSGGGHGGFSSGGRSFSSVSAPRPAPTAAPRPSAPPTATHTTVTTTRTVNTSSRYVSGGGSYYGGMGAGYGYNNGLLTGLIVGNMMHPSNTVVYSGSGAYSNNALLYPDGRVVNQNGQQVGTYQNGQFTEMQNGPIVAQPIPQDALKPAEKETSVGEWIALILLAVVAIFFIVILIGLFL